MTITDTYEKKEDGKIYQRRVETIEDVNGIEFTIQDQELEFDPRDLLEFRRDLADVRLDIEELEAKKTRLVSKITAIETAIDG